MNSQLDNSTEKALTVHQPWAELILQGRKTLELRSWPPPQLGRIWLHAGLKSWPELDALFNIAAPCRGAFVGSVEILGAAPLDARRWESLRTEHLDPGAYQPGYWGWSLDRARRLIAPLPAAGQRGLFTPDSPMLIALQSAVTSSVA